MCIRDSCHIQTLPSLTDIATCQGDGLDGIGPQLRNQDFNITNGDFFRWSLFWPIFADYFGMKMGSVETVDLSAYMADKDAIWQRIVERYELYPQPLDQVGMWSY